MTPWHKIFSESAIPQKKSSDESLTLRTLADLKGFLDLVHIRQCLVRPYQEQANYPVVECRALLPSFETDLFEYKNLPGFALVAFERKLDYFSEIFQFDALHSMLADSGGISCPLENQVITQNLQALASRLPKLRQEELKKSFVNQDVTLLDNYPELLPFLLDMDRAQVLALDHDNLFHLAGVFASFPSDIDSELKRFGIRIGKFVYGDTPLYERNRMFVYQFLMELYGFPIVSERRTSSALFARKLHRMGENFLLRVMGQSDRTITTYVNDGESRRYPRVEKLALVQVEADQTEAIDVIAKGGFFLDEEKRVAIMRVRYRQHRYDPANVRQDRALSIASQEILHPVTGRPLASLNVIKDAANLFLRLNDIVRGEYSGRIVYKRTEIVENTDTEEKRLKFLFTWLTKHQRRLISYGDEFFNRALKVINGYFQDPKKADGFESLRDLHQEVQGQISYIMQARKARGLEDLAARQYKGERITYLKMTREAIRLLTELQFEIVNFFPDLVDAVIKSAEGILRNSYLQRAYIRPPEQQLTATGLEIRKNYGRLVALLDGFKAVRKTRARREPKPEEVSA